MIEVINQKDNEVFKYLNAASIFDIVIQDYDALIKKNNLERDFQNPFSTLNLKDVLKDRITEYYELVLRICKILSNEKDILVILTSAPFRENPLNEWDLECISDFHCSLDFFLDFPDVYMNGSLRLIVVDANELEYYIKNTLGIYVISLFALRPGCFKNLLCNLNLDIPYPATESNFLSRKNYDKAFSKIFKYCNFCLESINTRYTRFLSSCKSYEEIMI